MNCWNAFSFVSLSFFFRMISSFSGCKEPRIQILILRGGKDYTPPSYFLSHSHKHTHHNASYLFPWQLWHIHGAEQDCVVEQIYRYKTIYFYIVTIIRYTFSLVMNKNLDAALINMACHNSHCTCIYHLISLNIQHH